MNMEAHGAVGAVGFPANLDLLRRRSPSPGFAAARVEKERERELLREKEREALREREREALRQRDRERDRAATAHLRDQDDR